MNRIRVFTQEICVFRDAIVERLAKNTINNGSTSDPYACVMMRVRCEDKMVKTIVRQGHVLPLSNQLAPRSAALDAYLRLFPLPDVV